MTATRTVALLLLAGLMTLSGCTRIQLEPLPEGMTAQPPAGWAERTHQVSQFNNWKLAGKLAVRQPSNNATAVINHWQQQGERYELNLSSSFLGMGTTQLKGTPGFMELTLSNGDLFRSSDPEQLVQAATGWQLPINSLVWWLRGLPAPDGNSRLLFDQSDRLAIIEQNGWEIRYDRWHQFVDDLPALPARITALKDDKRVRVVITEWNHED